MSSPRSDSTYNSAYRTNRETEMIKLRLKKTDPITRADDLALSRRQGREIRSIQHWKSELKRFRATVPVKRGDFKTLVLHSETGKRKGCGIYCKKAEQYVTCPSCKEFVWQKSCLDKLCVQLHLPSPDFESEVWTCPNCSKS